MAECRLNKVISKYPAILLERRLGNKLFPVIFGLMSQLEVHIITCMLK